MSIKHRWLKKPLATTSTMKQLYESGMTSSQIAQKLGLAKSSVSRRLKKEGIKLRSSSDYTGKDRYWRWKGENYLDPITRKRNQRKHRIWSKNVRERDDNRCTVCGIGEEDARLEAHHVVPLAVCINSVLEYDIENGITLCSQCHKNTHKR
jgi:hypothetical protein